jgi:predicted RNA-binding Zn ribbon-like protein
MGALEEICDYVNRGPAGPEREAIRTLLRANNGIDEGVARASRVLDAAARRAGLRARFEDGGLRFSSRSRILALVAESMADGSWSRLKACRADDCKWAFVDSARNRSRQWCDMAVCGNREKARRFRTRHA